MLTKEKKHEHPSTKKTKFLLAILFIIVAISVLFAAKFIFEKPRSVTDYPMEIHVVTEPNEIGVDAGPKLNFGWISPGSSAVRYIDIGNDKQNARVKLSATGDFADWISVSKNNFLIRTGEQEEIALTAAVPAGAAAGNYTANLRIEFFNSLF